MCVCVCYIYIRCIYIWCVCYILCYRDAPMDKYMSLSHNLARMKEPGTVTYTAINVVVCVCV